MAYVPPHRRPREEPLHAEHLRPDRSTPVNDLSSARAQRELPRPRVDVEERRKVHPEAASGEIPPHRDQLNLLGLPLWIQIAIVAHVELLKPLGRFALASGQCTRLALDAMRQRVIDRCQKRTIEAPCPWTVPGSPVNSCPHKYHRAQCPRCGCDGEWAWATMMHTEPGLRMAEHRWLTADNLIDASHRAGAVDNWAEMQLGELLVQTVQQECRFEGQVAAPSALSQRVIPQMIRGSDLLVQAGQTKDKWLGSLTGIIQQIDATSPELQAIMVCADSDLAFKANYYAEKLSRELGIATGGSNRDRPRDRRVRASRAQLIIASPPVIGNYMEDRLIDLCKLRMLVIDEADSYHNERNRFEEVVLEVRKAAPQAQLSVFANKLSEPGMLALIEKLQPRHPGVVLTPSDFSIWRFQDDDFVTNENSDENRILQYFLTCPNQNAKIDALEMLACLPLCQSRSKRPLVYMASQDSADSLADYLQTYTSVQDISIVTDHTALDHSRYNTVVNFDLPEDLRLYIERVGRRGWSSLQKRAFSLVIPEEMHRILAIECYYDTEIVEWSWN